LHNLFLILIESEFASSAEVYVVPAKLE